MIEIEKELDSISNDKCNITQRQTKKKLNLHEEIKKLNYKY